MSSFKSLSGEEIVKEHYIGALKTTRGAFLNKCQFCNAVRWQNENETICCQKGKVALAPIPGPIPILKRLLEGQDQRSKIFKKHIVPLNNSLALASIEIKYKKPPYEYYNPQLIIQGKAYYYIGPLEVEEGQQPKFASLYVHNPTPEGAARVNNLYLPKDRSTAERRVVEEI